jgi:hypothetical protein
MSNDDIGKENKKKKYQPLLIFQTRDPSHHTESIIYEKNHEIQSLGNETLKNDLKKNRFFFK